MMNIRSVLLCLSLWVVMPVLKVSAERPVDFSTQILPLLETHCVACHAEDESEGGLRLDSHAALMNGGESGPAVTAGTPQSSRMLLMAKGALEPKMPPEAEGFSEEELALLAEWIEQGASGPQSDAMPATRSTPRFPKIATAADATEPATAVAVAADGERLAIARFRSVTLQTVSGKVLNQWQDFPGKINGLRFSQDGTKLVVATGLTGKFGVAVLLEIGEPDAATPSSTVGAAERRFEGHRDTLYAAELSSDGRWLATAGYDREIQLWDVETGKPIRRLTGHNGAIFALAFSPDGQLLVSGSADETVKVWDVRTGERWDTLNQPEGEVLAVAFSNDGQHILACGADQRFRVWKLVSRAGAATNPLVTTRYIDDTALNGMATIPGGQAVVVVSESGNAKVLRTSDWNVAATLQACPATTSDVAVSSDGKTVFFSLFDGSLVHRDLPSIERSQLSPAVAGSHPAVFLDLGDPITIEEQVLNEQVLQQHASASGSVRVPQLARGAVVRGSIDTAQQVDRFRWLANAGEVWAIDCDALPDPQSTADQHGSLDPTIRIEDGEGHVVPRVRLQAVRESYFTFRGKDSAQSNDFRLFGWQDMQLDDYLYSNGEVTRLWMHPRGPDSGFDVYPGEGKRWTYFGTSHVTHALGEPAYVVKPLLADELPVANGLPVFEIGYQNDDDPMRRAGSNSRLIFTAPADGLYTVAVSDRRFEGRPGYRYELRIRPARPSFTASVSAIKQPLVRGAGREFTVAVERYDGFEGAVVFDCDNLPPGVRSTFPVTVEAGQRSANGILWLDAADTDMSPASEPQVVATARINGLVLERSAGTLGVLTHAESSRAIPKIVLDQQTGQAAETEIPELTIRQGETVSAVVKLERAKDFDAEVSFGKEKAGRNATHGVYVDNIGLNGLLLLKGMEQRQFFITADPISTPGSRLFYLKAELDGGITSLPIWLNVEPR